MNKEHLAKLLKSGTVEAGADRRLYFPHEEQLREPRVTVQFSVKFNTDGKVMLVSRKCKLQCSCEKCPFKGLCDDIEERIRM